MHVRRAALHALLCATALSCANEVLDPAAGGASPASSDTGGSSSGTLATGGSSSGTPATGGTGGSSTTATFVCEPGLTVSCYDGAPGTEGVGPCHGGTRTCSPDGSGWGPCEDQHVPSLTDNCVSPEDDDCDGVVPPLCEGIVPVAPTVDAFGWQSLQEHFIQDGAPCVGEVTVAIGDRLLCYAGADDRLHCAGGVYGQQYGSSFVDAGLEGPLQIFISPTSNVETGNSMCVVLRDGTMQCRGYWNFNGQLGTGDTEQQPQFAPWHGRADIARAATASSDQYCVLTTSGDVHCGGLGFGGPTTIFMGSATSVAFRSDGTLLLDASDVLRTSAGSATCEVGSAGLSCHGKTKGLAGNVVDGGLIGPEFEQGCLLDSGGTVTCFDLESILQGTYFEEGQVVALAVNGYSSAICAVYADGSLWCMGDNTNGKLGTGDTFPLPTETQVAPPGSVRVACQ